jgi:hypothetical protein
MCNFMIFCLARTGSTTLIHLLNRHPQISCLSEPFNLDRYHEYTPRVNGRRSLYATLDDIYQNYDGVKHVAGPNGWPFASANLNYDLLQYRAHRSILLTRSNTLRRLISYEMARQMNIWHFEEDSDRNIMRQFVFKAVDVGKVRNMMNEEASFLGECRQRLRANERQYYELTYESLFGSSVTPDEKLSVIDDIVAFLGFSAFEDGQRYGEVSRLLQACNTGSGTPRVYRRVPNIDQIDEELGCDETGWLLR